jgi:D-amino-acid oxidase
MMRYNVDAVVIGAGVIGLACARKLSAAGLETLVLERERQFGQGISSRNSEVVHAGLYYQPDSLKARLCRAGRDQLYDYCRSHGVAHQRLGKLVVASSENQVEALIRIADRARANGCNEVSLMDGAKARKLEPELSCAMALSSPQTGIIDSHALMLSLLGDVQKAGGILSVGSAVDSGEASNNCIVINTEGEEHCEITASYVVNSAGLDAPKVAAGLQGLSSTAIPPRCYAKGTYFTLTGKSPFQKLIYPVPESGGLGVHLSLDLQGQARFGPDVEWVEKPEYTVDPNKARHFFEAIKAYWPGCKLSRLQPGYVGIRPKIGTPDAFAEDFIIQSEAIHGVKGLINLYGMESPGLTACLAIADEVAKTLQIS